MKIALDLLNEKKTDITYHDLGFILTVLRDNAKQDDVYEFLNQVLKNMK